MTPIEDGTANLCSSWDTDKAIGRAGFGTAIPSISTLRRT